ncbi:MAG: fluoride efflux transporter CrcB [Acidimicrobiia bacterium]|nr:fluoride efflux transporter CrcB [Acidimicrobiia bacterium]
MAYLWVALGSALGGAARYASFVAVSRIAGHPFPYGTLLVNITGSFVIGVLAAVSITQRNDNLRLFLIPGLCGGFTTFSAFSLETFALLQEEQWAKAGLNMVLSVTLCLIAVAAGYWSAGALRQR